MTPKQQEAIPAIMRSACAFLEFCPPEKLSDYRLAGYRGPDPKQMHPSSGDKLLILWLAREMVEQIPDEYLHEKNCRLHGERLAVDDFYFLYNQNNGLYED